MEILHIDISGVTTVVFKEFNKYIWIRNKTSNPVYASLTSNVGEGVAGTTEILGRESGMILMSDAKTIYITGSGSVEIKASDFSTCPFKISAKGGDLITKTITENGTYSASDDSADGYSSVTVNVSGGGSLPSTYTQLEYVNCGAGTNGQSAFELQSYIPQKADTIKIVTTTPSTVDSEAAFFGTNEGYDSYELYYDTSFDVKSYGNSLRCDNFSEQIAGSLTKNTTIAYFYYNADYAPRIGCYRIRRYPYTGRIYSVNAYRPKTNEMLIDLVPCVRIADSTVGMFDLVNQAFYTSTIGDPFTAPET